MSLGLTRRLEACSIRFLVYRAEAQASVTSRNFPADINTNPKQKPSVWTTYLKFAFVKAANTLLKGKLQNWGCDKSRLLFVFLRPSKMMLCYVLSAVYKILSHGQVVMNGGCTLSFLGAARKACYLRRLIHATQTWEHLLDGAKASIWVWLEGRGFLLEFADFLTKGNF